MKISNSSFLSGLAIAAMLWGCGAATETETTASADELGTAVNVISTHLQTYPHLITYSGSLEAWETAFISGQTGVRIDRIHAEEGDFVKQGQLLATMNATQLNQAKLQVDLARREINRIDTLVKIGSVSGQQLDQAQNELENAESNLENLLENTELRAPFNGVITGRHFSRGEIFAPGAEQPSLLTLMQIDPIKLTIQVAEQYYRQVEEGMEADVTVELFAEEGYKGKVTKKHPQIHTGTRTFAVEISLPNRGAELKPGMFARVNIDLGATTGVFVPSYAVLSQAGTNERFVFVVDGNNLAAKIPVQVGSRYRDMVLIEKGLGENAQLVIEGMQRLVDGSTVRIIEADRRIN